MTNWFLNKLLPTKKIAIILSNKLHFESFSDTKYKSAPLEDQIEILLVDNFNLKSHIQFFAMIVHF